MNANPNATAKMLYRTLIAILFLFAATLTNAQSSDLQAMPAHGSHVPAITVNGTSTGSTVSAGSTLTVAVSGGPGNKTDWMGICSTGTPSSMNCRAAYEWAYLNCTQGPAPSRGLT